MASIIVATAVTGLLTLAVALFVVRGMEWRSYEFSFGREEESAADVLARWVSSPVTWALGFLLLVFGTGAVALAAVGAIDLPVPGGMAAVALIVGVLLLVLLVFGFYGFARSRGRSYSEAVVVSLLLLGVLFIGFVSANLVFGIIGG